MTVRSIWTKLVRRRSRVTPVLVPKTRAADLPNPEVQALTAEASLESQRRHTNIRSLVDTLQGSLASQALSQIRGGRN